jgi:hypothetical protein
MKWRIVGILVITASLSACGAPGEKAVPLNNPQGIEEAKIFLKRYADGQPMASEVSAFPQILEQVRKADPAKADMLQKGFDEMKKSPGSLKAKAKELLGKL